jgi:pilus assembly protein Flp/PilA
MFKLINKLRGDRKGASAAEYALILAILGAGIVAGAIALQSAIGTRLNKSATCVTTPTIANC